MSASSRLFMEMQASKMPVDEYFEWLNSDDNSEKPEITPKELLIGNKPCLEDLDNLFEIDEEDDDEADN